MLLTLLFEDWTCHHHQKFWNDLMSRRRGLFRFRRSRLIQKEGVKLRPRSQRVLPAENHIRFGRSKHARLRWEIRSAGGAATSGGTAPSPSPTSRPDVKLRQTQSWSF